ncbi:unnamed protein product [Bursaphelenchus xylophilus]|uniref:(pine wood nematode) hypothetical protein n=1 Tax=Bursaphelenchus xylophilus TaxID=6326 RepID=A0A1I7RQI4_BURXY|nr:unnamed protein product [Bursaphelenchus xylophilus]CAG9104630.1 unnamed protein product [Bursaphelenchus xylophilus]
MPAAKIGVFDEAFVGRVHVHKPVLHLWTPIFPLLSAFFGILAFVAGYIISVANDHQEAWFSFISDGGSLAPESCIFGILLNFSSFFWFLTCFARHYQLIQYVHFHRGPQTKFRAVVWFMLVVGMISGVGTAVVANFQLSTVPIAHGLGATIAFLCGMIYVWCYVVVSVVMRPKFSPKALTVFRILLALIVTASLTLHEMALYERPFVRKLSDGTKPKAPEFPKDTGIFRYKPDHYEYLNHIVAALAEWVLAVGFFVIIASLCYELSTFEINTLTKDQQRYLVEENRRPVLVSIKHSELLNGNLETQKRD